MEMIRIRINDADTSFSNKGYTFPLDFRLENIAEENTSNQNPREAVSRWDKIMLKKIVGVPK